MCSGRQFFTLGWKAGSAGLLIDCRRRHQHDVGATGEQETIWAVADALRA